MKKRSSSKKASIKSPRKLQKKTAPSRSKRKPLRVRPAKIAVRETGFTPVPSIRPDDRIPAHYGEDKLVLLVRDPWWLYAYWEVTPERQREAARRAGRNDYRTVLRVYDVTGAAVENAHTFFDIELNVPADNWYIDVGRPDREWAAEIGFRTADGRFFALVRSNRVRTPAFGLSDVLDEEWMLPDEIYYRLLGRSLGSVGQSGSSDVRALLEKYLKNAVSSERMQEPAKKTSGATPN